MAIFETTQPPVEPVTLTDAKNHLRVDVDDDDNLIRAYIRAAREYCETFSGRAYVLRTIELTLDAWPSAREIILPRPPLVSVTAVRYQDVDNVTQTLVAGTDYIVDTNSTWGRVLLPRGRHWPTAIMWPATPITVEYISGYATTAVIVGEDVGTGDNTRVSWPLAQAPVESMQEIRVDGGVTTAYTIDMETGIITFAVAPAAGHAIEADYTPASFYTGNIPQYVKTAMLLCVGNWYENRENVLPAGSAGKVLPMGAEYMLWGERTDWSAGWNR